MHVDQLPAPWALFDAHGRVIRANPALLRILGLAEDADCPQTMAHILSVEALGLFETFVLPALDFHGEVREVVLSLSTTRGQSVPVQCQFEQVQPTQGADQPARHQVVMLQMVERMRSQEQLRRVANAVELAPGAVFHLVQQNADELPACVYLSSEVQDFTGVTRMAIRGDLRALTGRIERLHRPALWRRALRALERNEPLEHEFSIRMEGGQLRWLSLKAKSKRYRSGRIEWFGHLSDSTENRRQREALKDSSQQLQQSQRMEAIGTMAGGIAHDFNNLLAAILGNVALAREDAAQGRPPDESLQDIETAARTGRDLVRRMMVFSRRQPRSVSEVDLAALCHDTLSFLKASLPAAARLNLRLPDRPVHTAADAVQLQQVLINLCTNAWQALPGGVGDIDIRLEAEVGDQWARLSVTDSGRGMDTHTVQRIFDPFFTTKEVGQGTGLGLSVVHAIVHEHGGQIEVRSELGRGSCFVVRLPASLSHQAVMVGPAEPSPPIRGRGLSVVYVDDNPLMMRLAQRTLERHGYSAQVFADPSQALTWLNQDSHIVDAVISDVNMPGMTGVQLCRMIKARRPATPVFLTTGALSEELQAEAAEAGADGMISKEQTFAPLLQAVQRALVPERHGAFTAGRPSSPGWDPRTHPAGPSVR